MALRLAFRKHRRLAVHWGKLQHWKGLSSSALEVTSGCSPDKNINASTTLFIRSESLRSFLGIVGYCRQPCLFGDCHTARPLGAKLYSSQLFHQSDALHQGEESGRSNEKSEEQARVQLDEKVVEVAKQSGSGLGIGVGERSGTDGLKDCGEDPRSTDQRHAGGEAGPSGRAAGSSPENLIAVDRSGLAQETAHSHGQVPGKEEETPLAEHLKTLIRFRGGPITVAEYMKEVLINPSDGFYMNRDVFGTKGDFVTSPDISQMFGELMGIWALVLWQQMGQPKEVNLVELGPGRGALMADLLRGTAQFREFTSSLRIHLVEVSPALHELQKAKLQCQAPSGTSASLDIDTSRLEDAKGAKGPDAPGSSSQEDGEEESKSKEGPSISAISGVPVWWHASLEEVPRGPVIVIGHEFLDALPVHQFQRTELGWCERLVDIAPDWSQRHLRLVLSKGPTVAVKVYLKKRLESLSLTEQRENPVIEVCPGVIDLAKELSERIGADGGGALLIDYGDDKLAGDSLQAIKQHKFVDLLHAPGTADLSAWVDFAVFKRAAAESGADVQAYGPLTQLQLLGQLGINARVEVLLENASEEQAESLEQEYMRLVGDHPGDEAAQKPPGMGAQYKAVAIVKKGQGLPFPFT